MSDRNEECEELQDGLGVTCEEIYNCCDCGASDQEDGCGCLYCWSCNACSSCLEDS